MARNRWNTTADAKKWEKLRKLGMLRFVLFYGMIRFGLLATVLSFIMDRVLTHGMDVSKYFAAGWGRALFECLVQWTLTGAIVGILMWFLFVRRASKV
jgi:hypothetical protein